jgi:hypothetical protein
MLFAMGNLIETIEFCKRVVDTYRLDNPRVKLAWQALTRALADMTAGVTPSPDIDGPFIWKTDRVILPDGFAIKFPNLRRDPEGRNYLYTRHQGGREEDYTGGTSFLENLNQSIARSVVMHHMTEITSHTGYRALMQSHDELAYLFPEDKAEQGLKDILEIMHVSPPWWTELKVMAEGDIGDSYYSAK